MKGTIMPELIMTKGQELVAEYGYSVLGALLILVVGRLAVGGVRSAICTTMRKAKADEALTSFVSSLSFAGLMAFVIIAALGKLGIPTASFVAVIGAAGLAVGLALQGSLSNFAAGFLMLVFKPFKTGDFILAAGTAGKVEKIEIFTTTLTTPDNKVVIIPNGKVMGDNITNVTAKDTRRLDLMFGVSYNDDLDKVMEILKHILDADERVLKEPAYTVAVAEHADSSINIVCRPWVKADDYWALHFDLHKKVKEAFDKESITIPYPQRDIHMYNHSA